MSWVDRYVAFDTETTGLNGDARIIEIALVLFDRGKVVSEYSTLVNPGNEVDWTDANVQKALEVNKIKLADLQGKPSFPDIFHHLFQHFRAADVWVAHNTEFDTRMMNQEQQRHKKTDFPLRPRLSLDTKLLSNKLHPHEKGHRLMEVAPRWGVVQDGAHRAASDAITCGRILSAMVQKNALPSDIGDMMSFHKQASVEWGSTRRRR